MNVVLREWPLYYWRCLLSLLELDARYNCLIMAPNTHHNFFPISCLFMLTFIIRQLQIKDGHSAYRMTALLSDTFLVWFRVVEIQLDSYGPRHTSVILWCKLVCISCKPIYTLLFGAYLHLTIKTHVSYDSILHTKGRLYYQRCIVL